MSGDHTTPATTHEVAARHPDSGGPAYSADLVPLAGAAAALRSLRADGPRQGRGNGPARQAALLQLQRQLGNQATRRLHAHAGLGAVSAVQRRPGNDGDDEPAQGKAGQPTAPHKADPLPKAAMDHLVAHQALVTAFGTIHKVQPFKVVMVPDQKTLFAKLDEVCIRDAVEDEDPTQPGKRGLWKPGWAAAQGNDAEGFADQPTKTAYVMKTAELPTATMHEMLHLNSSAAFRDSVGEAINEGMTEYLAIKAYKAGDMTPARRKDGFAYDGHRIKLEKLFRLVGEATVTHAYFHGPAPLIDAFESLQGKGSWKQLNTAMAAPGLEEMGKLLKRPAAPTDMAQRLAAMHARLDGWVQDHDLEVLAAIYQAPGTDRAAARAALLPRVNDLYSSRQRERLQAILDGK
jgi:hypothetical protein